jgi:hypothetical protein
MRGGQSVLKTLDVRLKYPSVPLNRLDVMLKGVSVLLEDRYAVLKTQPEPFEGVRFLFEVLDMALKLSAESITDVAESGCGPIELQANGIKVRTCSDVEWAMVV